MTLELVCSRCGHLVHGGLELRPPADVLKVLGNSCRNCGATLLLDKFTVEIVKLDDHVLGHGREAPMAVPAGE